MTGIWWVLCYTSTFGFPWKKGCLQNTLVIFFIEYPVFGLRGSSDMAPIIFFRLNVSISCPSKPQWIWELELEREKGRGRKRLHKKRERGRFACQHLDPDREAGWQRGLGARGAFLVQLFKDCWLASSRVGPGAWEQAAHIPPSDCSWWNTHVPLSSQHLAHANATDPSRSYVLWPTPACQTWAGLRSDTDGPRCSSFFTWQQCFTLKLCSRIQCI